MFKNKGKKLPPFTAELKWTGERNLKTIDGELWFVVTSGAMSLPISDLKYVISSLLDHWKVLNGGIDFSQSDDVVKSEIEILSVEANALTRRIIEFDDRYRDTPEFFSLSRYEQQLILAQRDGMGAYNKALQARADILMSRKEP